MTDRTARCACGQLRAEVRGEPVRVSICHCRQCQRRTGSPFGQQARFTREDVKIHGTTRSFQRIADSGNRITFHFCPDCGSTVYYELEVEPALYGIPVGCFADPDFPPPRVSVYETHKHGWVNLPDHIQHIE
ncbi:MAG: GFA family protein [Xanthomonadales bacterium]|nr:GFA family protein [Xanthomonadales bacterium]